MSMSGLGNAVLAGVVVLAVGIAVADDDGGADRGDPQRSSTTVTRVIDGDTVEIASGDHVRIIGIDAPERGACGSVAATQDMRRMVEGREVTLISPTSVQDGDKYERLLRYVEVFGEDTGLLQIQHGRAVARYDSRDGYDHHPREDQYREEDQRSEGKCEQHQRAQAERWHEARRLAKRANIRIHNDETAARVLRRARDAIRDANRRREQVRRAQPTPSASPSPYTPAPSSNAFVPPAGWTTDALTPGYTGCRQGYPGGRINGVYVWKPISC